MRENKQAHITFEISDGAIKIACNNTTSVLTVRGTMHDKYKNKLANHTMHSDTMNYYNVCMAW